MQFRRRTSNPQRIRDYAKEYLIRIARGLAGGKSPEHDWVVTVHEQFTNTTIRNRLDTSGLCLP